MKNHKPTILVTGADGQVGKALICELNRIGAVVASSRSSFIQADLTIESEINNLINLTQPSIIVNPAAYTAVDKAESEPDLAKLMNIEAPRILAQQAFQRGIPLIHFSTDYVFDGEGEYFRDEEAATGPLNVYGETKLQGEKVVLQSGADAVIFRTSWVFSSSGNNFLKTMLKLSDKNELKVVNDQVGSPTSAQMLAWCTARTIEQGLSEGFNKISGIYHLCNSNVATWKVFAQEIFNQAQELGLLTRIPAVKGISTAEYVTPAKRPLNSRLNCTKFKQTFGINSLPSWEEDVTKVLLQIIEKDKI